VYTQRGGNARLETNVSTGKSFAKAESCQSPKWDLGAKMGRAENDADAVSCLVAVRIDSLFLQSAAARAERLKLDEDDREI